MSTKKITIVVDEHQHQQLQRLAEENGQAFGLAAYECFDAGLEQYDEATRHRRRIRRLGHQGGVRKVEL